MALPGTPHRRGNASAHESARPAPPASSNNASATHSPAPPTASSPSNARLLNDAVSMLTLGTHALESDEFSECFRPVARRELYNSGALYAVSIILRYFILFPLRVLLLAGAVAGVSVWLAVALYLESDEAVSHALHALFRATTFIFNCWVRHTGEKPRVAGPHVFVANHTSFLDFVLMSSHRFCHACIAENHGGLFGFIFSRLLARNGSIPFRRSERQDRATVIARVRAHIAQARAPMAIFPEGTCVNNRCTVLFQRGAFTLGVPVCPVAIRYAKTLVDPYWNRRCHGFARHIFYLMTRWYVEVEIHWFAPVTMLPGESAVQFAHRVKRMISARAGLRNTLWNGYFKSAPVANDRALLRKAYCGAYRRVVAGELGAAQAADVAAGRDYLLDEHVDSMLVDTRVVFGAVTRSDFNREWCREYLRLKEE